MITKEHYQFIRQHPAFVNLPVELFDKLAVEIQYRKIPKGQIIFFAGDRRERLFLLSQGYVRIEQYDSTDTFSYMDYVKKDSVFPYGGMFFDECSIIQPALSPMSNISPFLLICSKNILRRVWISFCLLPSGCRKSWNFRNFVCVML